MNLQELFEATREEVGDNNTPPLLSDALLTRYANDAEREASRRARLLVDSTTSATCTLAFTASNPIATLDARVIFVRRAKVVGETSPLGRAVFREMDDVRAGWEDETAAIPTHFITDWQTGKIRLYPTPTANLSLSLTVIRLPLVDLAEMDDVPEISARYHEGLIHWMKHKAYLVRDADLYNEGESLKSLALFEQEFGKRSSAVDEEWIAREQQLDFDGTY